MHYSSYPSVHKHNLNKAKKFLLFNSNYFLFILILNLSLCGNFFLSLKVSLIFFSDNYDILSLVRANVLTDFIDIVKGTDVYGAIKLVKNELITIKLDQFPDPINHLATPFEIYALVKLNVDVTSCLFQIISNKENKLSLCFTPEGEDLIRITLNGSDLPENGISFHYLIEDYNAFVNIILAVNDKNVEFYSNCEKIETQYFDSDYTIENINLEKDSILHFGKLTEESNLFEVST